MIYASYPSSTPGKSLDVIEVTDATITIRAPNGRTKTIPRPVDYDPERGRIAVVAAVKKAQRTLESTWSTNICEGMWTVKTYSDGTRTASLTERWETPGPLSALETEGQRAAQREFEASRKSG